MREYSSKRELLNQCCIVIVAVNGDNLPHDFPAWQTVYSFFRRAIESGLWDKI